MAKREARGLRDPLSLCGGLAPRAVAVGFGGCLFATTYRTCRSTVISEVGFEIGKRERDILKMTKSPLRVMLASKIASDEGEQRETIEHDEGRLFVLKCF